MPYTPEPLPTYTFSNGAVAHVHRIGQFTIAALSEGAQKKIPTIPVPTFDVDDLKNQPNPHDPDYQAALQARNGRINTLVMDGLIELAVDIEIDHEALDRVKATMELIGMPLDEISEKVAYVKHCCIHDVTREMGALGKLIRGDIEEAIEAATATFPDNVPGPGVVEVQPTVERRELQLSV